MYNNIDYFDNNRAEQLYQKYLNLDPVKKEIVHIFTLMYYTADITELVYLIPGNLKKNEIYKELTYLKSAGFLEYVGDLYCISREPRELILEHLISLPGFYDLNSKILHVYPYGSSCQVEIVRELRIAVYSQDHKYIRECYKNCTNIQRRYDKSPAMTIFNAPFSARRLELLPPEIQIDILTQISDYHFTNGIAGSDRTELLIRKTVEYNLNTIELLEPILFSHWSQCNMDDITNDINHGYALARYKAILAVENREWENANNFFKSSVILYQDASVLYYVIHLIQVNNHDEIRAFIRKASQSNLSKSIKGALEPLIALCSVIIGEQNTINIPHKTLDPLNAESIFGVWVRLLCNYWLEDPMLGYRLKTVKKKFHELEEFELAEFYKKEFSFLKKGEGVASLLKPLERWESVLTTLINRYSDGGEYTEDKDLRLVFRIGTSQEHLILEPAIQKKNKKGAWSQGRKVDYYDVPRYYSEMDISPNDREIVELGSYLAGSYYYHNKENAAKRLEQAKLIVGHPLLLDNKSKSWITVEEIPLKLNVNHKADRINLSFNRIITDDSGLIITKKDNNWQITFISEKQIPIINLIKQKLSVPANKVAKLTEFFSAIKDVVSINGDIETLGKDLETVSGSYIPQVFIEPYGNGLHFKLMAVPTDDNQYFIPGCGKKEYIGFRDGISVIVNRELDSEVESVNTLINSINILTNQDDGEFEWEVPEGFEALEILEQLKSHPMNPIFNWPKGETIKIVRSVTSSDLFSSIHKKRDWFELSGEVKIDSERVLSLKQIMALAETSKSRFIKLETGEYIALTKSLKKDLDRLTTYSQKSRGDDIKIHPLALVAMEDSFTVQKFEVSKKWLLKFKNNHNKVFKIPVSARVELRDYQEDGFLWMMRLAESGAGALLADDMGLGKTVQAIVMLVAKKSSDPALIVVPASLIFNWADEIEKFAPSLNVHILGSDNRDETVQNLKGGDILITSYGLVQRNSELFIGRTWSTLILDEAQALKNSTTKRTKAISSIPRDFTLMTTGTPIENHLGELWSLFNIILPGFLGSSQNFKEKFQYPIEHDKDRDVRIRLKRLISPFILRRTKEEVLTELPPKTEINLLVEMNKDEKIFYEALRQRAVEKLENSEADNDSRFIVLAEITRLRQACCHPRLIDKDSLLGSSKMELFSEKITELIETKHQALVFSQFVGHLKLIAEHLDNKGIPYFYLDGSIPSIKRAALVNGFQNGEKPIFLISLKAGGSGLNLTAADYIFHMDPWWNPAVEDQASDRAHRIGQERPVTVYRLITVGSIEEQIISMHQEKRSLAESLLSDSATSLKLGTKELINIISGG